VSLKYDRNRKIKGWTQKIHRTPLIIPQSPGLVAWRLEAIELGKWHSALYRPMVFEIDRVVKVSGLSV